MLNPYVLLACFVGALGLFGSGVSIGVKWERNDALARIATAQDTAIKAANVAASTEIERTVAAAKAEADARITSRTAWLKGELDAAKKSRPQCARDTESMGLLNDAVRAANGEKAADTSVPSVVRTADGPGGWLGAITKKLGVSSGGLVWPVSETPR